MDLTKKDETALSCYNFSKISRYWQFSDQ